MPTLRQIDHAEIQRLQAADHKLLCLDVRDDYRQMTLDAGGWKIPYNQIEANADRLKPYAADAIAVVCCARAAGSQRTVVAARALRRLGFLDVRELKGGLYAGWILKAGAKVKMPTPEKEKIEQ